MKQITSGLKTVNYFGIELQIPKSITHICTQSDGKLWLYESCHGEAPELRNRLDTDIPVFWFTGDYDAFFIKWCEVDLEGQDWTKTLMEV